MSLLQRNTFQLAVAADGNQTFAIYNFGQLEWYRSSTSSLSEDYASVRAVFHVQKICKKEDHLLTYLFQQTIVNVLTLSRCIQVHFNMMFQANNTII